MAHEAACGSTLGWPRFLAILASVWQLQEEAEAVGQGWAQPGRKAGWPPTARWAVPRGGPRVADALGLPLQGLGGQHDYFGLWVDADFGKGHSRAKPTCTTYNSPQLSSKENFHFDKMEVWAVGDPPESQLVSGGS